MSRAGFNDIKNGRNIKLEDANEQLKQLLTDSFGSPVCKVEVDAAGKEVKCTVVAGPGAASLIESGMIANATMFHPWYSTDKNEWQVEMELSTGNGLATGKVTYEKVPHGKGGQAVRVSGTLSADGVKLRSGATIKDSKYVVAGEQVYDANRKEWYGKWTLDVAYRCRWGQHAQQRQGTMTVNAEMLPENEVIPFGMNQQTRTTAAAGWSIWCSGRNEHCATRSICSA